MQMPNRYVPNHGVKRRRVPVGYAVIIALVLSGAAVLSTSRAAFTDTTSNEGNEFAAGDVILNDDDGITGVMFNVDDMAPGDSVTNCIEVSYEGSIDPGLVKLYSGLYVDGGDLDDNLDVVIQEGDGGVFDDCSGFTSTANIFNNTLTNFDTRTTYGTGVGTWDPGVGSVTPVVKSYRIAVTMNSLTPNAVQGDTVTGLEFVWEVQS
jgi:predicted ribosomally synthesized peptide with SipW-like signal peptide